MSKSKGKKPSNNIPAEGSPHPEEDVLLNAISLGSQGSMLKRLTNIHELLRDRETMLQIAEIVGTGGSIATVEMAVGLPPNMLKTWLDIGKTESQDNEYNMFYRFYLAAASEARRAAEASLLMKSPAQWLDRCDPLKQLQDAAETTEVITTTAKKQETHLEYREFD